MFRVSHHPYDPHPPAATPMNSVRPIASTASSYTTPPTPVPHNEDPIDKLVQGTEALTVNGHLAPEPPKKPKMTSRLTRMFSRSEHRDTSSDSRAVKEVKQDKESKKSSGENTRSGSPSHSDGGPPSRMNSKGHDDRT